MTLSSSAVALALLALPTTSTRLRSSCSAGRRAELTLRGSWKVEAGSPASVLSCLLGPLAAAAAAALEPCSLRREEEEEEAAAAALVLPPARAAKRASSPPLRLLQAVFTASVAL